MLFVSAYGNDDALPVFFSSCFAICREYEDKSMKNATEMYRLVHLRTARNHRCIASSIQLNVRGPVCLDLRGRLPHVAPCK